MNLFPWILSALAPLSAAALLAQSANLGPPPQSPAQSQSNVASVRPPASKKPARVISREGVLRRTHNIQAPADYELRDSESGELIDYIQRQPKQELKSYIGSRVMVSGPEVLDPRWPRTPILEVQTLDRAP